MARDIFIRFYDEKLNRVNVGFDDFYDRLGRDYEWFDNLRGTGFDVEYDYLDYRYDYKIRNEILDKDFPKDNLYECGYDYNAIDVKDYLEWYNKYKPYYKAGWVSKYDKWLYDKKGIVPNDDKVTLYREENDIDKEWLEYEKDYCSDTILVEIIKEVTEKFPNVKYLFFYFG